MSTKEIAYSIIDNLNDIQLLAAVSLLKQLVVPLEAAPDEWDREMISRAKRENNGETVSIEDLSKELGIEYGSL